VFTIWTGRGDVASVATGVTDEFIAVAVQGQR